MRNDTLERVLRLIGLLQRRRWTLSQLALELGVTTRTVRRDLEALSVTGFPVRSGYFGDIQEHMWTMGHDGRCCVCQRL